jgi:hypothetical protein
MKPVLVATLVSLCVLLPSVGCAAEGAAPAATFSWLSDARGISRAWSASRDTPTLNLTWFPRLSYVAGGEFAFFTWRRPRWTLRPGFAGLMEAERDVQVDGLASGPWPAGNGKLLWRGSYAAYAALELDAPGKRICDACALELTLQYRHESEHYTGSNAGGDAGEDVRHTPYVGDDLIVDAALSERSGAWSFVQRAYLLWSLPGRSSYSAGAAFDLHARFRRWQLAHPFASAYGEYRAGTELHGRDFPDAHRLRVLLGVALSSTIGDLMVYGFADAGNRYGVRALTNEATLGLGLRLALGSHAGL